ncbi:hypothetical protein H4R19_004631 [Coemansia spiralis]|nr:hypothetical protein H4R19_004631 [Coemansia spiralis]
MAASGPVDRLRHVFRSSAFVPATWSFAETADGAVSMICEVIMALDRQRENNDAQAAELRQHLYHHSRPPKRRTDRHNHARSRSLELGPPCSLRPSQSHGGYAHGYDQGVGPLHASPRAASTGPLPGMVRGQITPRSELPCRSRGFMRSDEYVGIIDDEHAVFSRGTVARSLPRGTRIVAGGTPVATRCPQCRHHIMTVIQRHTSAKNIAASVAVAAAGVAINSPATLLPLALTVLDLSSLKRKVHHCPYCDYRLGRHITITIPPT